jgi:hypothetical protein
MTMRRLLPWLLVGAVALTLGAVAFTQRSGPTPEDKALAARLIQEARRDALLAPDPGERASQLARVVTTARSNSDEDKPAVTDEEALNLLRKALEDAEALPAEKQTGAISRVLFAAQEIDGMKATEWAEEERKHGHPVPPELAPPEGEPTDAAGEVDITANDDLPAAIKQAQDFGEPHQRLEAKLQLGSRLMSNGLWMAQGKQLLGEAAALAERMIAETGGDERLLRVARSVATHDPERALPLYQKVYDTAMALKDPGEQVKTLHEIAGSDGEYGFDAPAAGGGPGSEGLAALRARATQQAAQIALKLPEGNSGRDAAIRAALTAALETPEGEGAARFDAALRWARVLPTAGGARSHALSQVADVVRSTDRKLADDLIGEARDVLPALDSNWDAVTARASTIAAAALAGDKRCWEWASQDAVLIRRSTLPAIEGELDIPVEFKRAMAETMVLGATFASGDIQRARKFVQSQAQLGGYEAARALWTVIVYIWDPSMSFDLADKLISDLQGQKPPAGGCTAALAVAPAFAYRMFYPDAEVSERAAPLMTRALDFIATSPQAMDRAFAAAGLAAACAPTDGALSARAVSLARDALGSIGDEKARDYMAEPICAMVAVADPQAAAAMTADIKRPDARINARLAAAEAMRFDFADIRTNLPGFFGARAMTPPPPPPPPPVPVPPA